MSFLKQLKQDTAKSMHSGIKYSLQAVWIGVITCVAGFLLAIIGYNIGGSAGTIVTVVGLAIVAIGVFIAGGIG